MSTATNDTSVPTVRSGRFTVPRKAHAAAPASDSAVASTASPGVSAAAVAAFVAGAENRDLSPPPKTFFALDTKPRESKLVHVEGKIRRGDLGPGSRTAYLEIPPTTNDRLLANLQGASAPGIIGLIEYALDELERKGETLVIKNR